jgi:5-hydroxyisourate hydrolase
MSGLTSHVLDTALGTPAAGVAVTLFELQEERRWSEHTTRRTDEDGRTGDFFAGAHLHTGTYRLRFALAEYHELLGTVGFYPYVDVVFIVADAAAQCHVPLLVSPSGYTTYRGS